MSIVDKIKMSSHAACCVSYSLLYSGYHFSCLYMVVAASYAAITLAELKH